LAAVILKFNIIKSKVYAPWEARKVLKPGIETEIFPVREFCIKVDDER